MEHANSCVWSLPLNGETSNLFCQSWPSADDLQIPVSPLGSGGDDGARTRDLCRDSYAKWL
jgi:hypothetical protein